MTGSPRGVIESALAAAGRVGDFFEVSTDPREEVDPTWRPLRELAGSPALAERIAHVRRVLSAQAEQPVEERVAASIALQGFAARLVSAPLATVVLAGVLPDAGPDRLHWRVATSGPWPLWTDTVDLRDPADLPALVVEEMMEPLVTAVRALVPVSPRVLWGNVASSVAGAKRVLGSAVPEAGGRAAEVAAGVLDHPLLRDAGVRGPARGPDHGWTFRRRSCCLYYRVPGTGTCGDCVLAGR